MPKYFFVLLTISIYIPQSYAQSRFIDNNGLYEILDVSLREIDFSKAQLRNDSSDMIICINNIVQQHSLIDKSTKINLKNFNIDFLTKEDMFIKYVKNYILITTLTESRKNIKICFDIVNIENQLFEEVQTSQCVRIIKMRNGQLKLKK